MGAVDGCLDDPPLNGTALLIVFDTAVDQVQPDAFQVMPIGIHLRMLHLYPARMYHKSLVECLPEKNLPAAFQQFQQICDLPVIKRIIFHRLAHM